MFWERMEIPGIALSQERRMPRFHFEIVNGVRIEDPVGLFCKSEDQAKQVAQDIARQIAIDVQNSGMRKIVVKAEDGQTIFETPVKG
jgi:hypothetical protein